LPPNSSYTNLTSLSGTQYTNEISLMVDDFDSPYGIVEIPDGSGHNKPYHLKSVPVCVQNFTHQLTTIIVTPDPSHAKNLSLKTNFIIPLNVDEIMIDGYVAPTSNNTNLALSPDSVVVVRSGNGAIGIRLLSSQMSSNSSIKIRTDGPGKLMPVNTTYSYMWQVDGTGLSHGSGRLAVSHKLLGDTNPQSYPVVFLWVTAQINTETDVSNLAKIVSTATFSQSVNGGNWNVKVSVGGDDLSITRSNTTNTFSQRLVNGQVFNTLTQPFQVTAVLLQEDNNNSSNSSNNGDPHHNLGCSLSTSASSIFILLFSVFFCMFI